MGGGKGEGRGGDGVLRKGKMEGRLKEVREEGLKCEEGEVRKARWRRKKW